MYGMYISPSGMIEKDHALRLVRLYNQIYTMGLHMNKLRQRLETIVEPNTLSILISIDQLMSFIEKCSR